MTTRSNIKRAIQGAWILLWLAMAGLWASGVAAGPPLQINLAPNPGFEHGLPLKQQVYDWTPAPEFPDAEYTWDDQEAHRGEHSLRLHASLKPNAQTMNFPALLPGLFATDSQDLTDKIPPHFSLIINGSGAMSRDGSEAVGWESMGGQFGCSPDPATGETVLCIAHSAEESTLSGSGLLSVALGAYPDVLYRARCEVRLQEATGETHLLISWYGPDGWISNTDDGFRLSGKVDWTELEIADYAPKAATYGRLGLRSDDNSGAAYFRRARVWMEAPQEYVLLGVPRWADVSSADIVAQTVTDASYALALSRDTERAGEESAMVYQPLAAFRAGEGNRLTFTWDPEAKGLRLWKRFEGVPQETASEPHVSRLVRQFLRATRWLLPIWLDEAAAEMFGGRQEWVSLVDRWRKTLPQGAEDWEAQLALALADIWAAEPEQLAAAAKRCDALARKYSDMDVRCDQLLYLAGTAKQVSEEQSRAERVRQIEASLETANERQRWQLLTQRVLVHWEAEDYEGILADADQAVAVYGEKKVHPLIILRKIQSLIRLGRLEEARAELRWIKNLEGFAYAEELSQAQWILDLALGADGPRPRFVGDEDKANGDWPGRFGTEGAFVIGPGGGWGEFGAFKSHGTMTLSTAVPGIVARTPTMEFPSDKLHAPYNPYRLCKSDSFVDDRGEAWGNAIEGPDLVVRLEVPVGAHRLSLLTSGYAADLFLEAMRQPVASAPERPGEIRLYRQFLVFGPAHYRVRLYRGSQLMTYLAGVFLDPVGPEIEPSEDPRTAGREAWQQLAAWEESLRAQAPDLDRLIALTRSPQRPPDAVLVEAASQIVHQKIEDPEELAALLTEELRNRPAALHALVEALCKEPRALRRLNVRTVARCARNLARAYDLPAIRRLMRKWAEVAGTEAIQGLKEMAEQALDFESLVGALTVLHDLGAATPEEKNHLAELLTQWGREEEAETLRRSTR